MGLIELGSASAVADFISQNKNVVVTYSAHWCGPCKASKPALEELARKYSSSSSQSSGSKVIKIGIVYENDLGNDIHTYKVRAFPTYVLFQQSRETNRIEGANIAGVEQMIESASGIDTNLPTFSGSGNSLGSTTSNTAQSIQEARLARLAKLGGTSNPVTTPPATAAPAEEKSNDAPMAMETATTTNDDVMMETDDVKPAAADNDGTMEAEVEGVVEMKDPTVDLNVDIVKQLTDELGFTLIRAQKGLLYGTTPTVEGAIEWLTEHQDDIDIDEPIACIPVTKSVPGDGGLVAQSYKCNECGKILSNMANLELHANKTGHSDFEESTTRIQPMTAEEKADKVAEIKELLKVKRAAREEKEQAELVEREKQRRFMGKEVLKTKEQLEIEQRKREVLQRKKEKQDFIKERQRLREQLARDKAERAAANGKLASKLSVDGYRPDIIQYDDDKAQQQQQHGDDNDAPAGAKTDTSQKHESTPTPNPATNKKPRAEAGRIPEYITKVSSYKAGGDGGKCLKILFLYVKNIVENPTDTKFRTIKMDNNAYKTKVKPFIGAKSILLAAGFIPDPSNDQNLVMLDENLDLTLLSDTKEKLNAALVAFG